MVIFPSVIAAAKSGVVSGYAALYAGKYARAPIQVVLVTVVGERIEFEITNAMVR